MTSPRDMNPMIYDLKQLEEHPAITHVDQRLVVKHMEHGKTEFAFPEIRQLIAASETVLECIQNGAMFASDEASISAYVEATDLLESAIEQLKAKGF
ncbi:hypothetical protein [Methylophilus sp. 3sh_L]|uniref:hypothetical protein n=1 Tax=Methylophilus sp. 3sh_L TaxID=3377114 RepID=UPI00398F214A